jgi:hypothetical protein
VSVFRRLAAEVRMNVMKRTLFFSILGALTFPARPAPA